MNTKIEKQIIKNISKQYKKLYTVVSIDDVTSTKTVKVTSIRKSDGFRFSDLIALDINVIELVRDEKLSLLGI